MRTLKKIVSYTSYLWPFSQKVAYIGWLGHNNWGDETLFRIMKKQFKKEFALIPSESIEKIYMKTRFLIDYKCIFLGGGTLINNVGFHEELLRFLTYKKCRFFVVGTGVRSVDFWSKYNNEKEAFSSWLDLLKKAKKIGVRGPLSFDYLNDNGIVSDIIGDPVLSLAEKSIYPKHRKNKLLINIGATNGILWGDEEHFWKVILSVIISLIENGWDIGFLSVWDKDDIVIQRIIKQISKTRIKLYKAYQLSFEQISNLFKEYDIFMGEKLHSVVVAHCTYTPSIIFEYRPKCLDYALSVGMQTYCIRTDIATKELVLNLIYQLYDKIEIVQEVLYENIKKLNKKRDIFFNSMVKDILSNEEL